MRDSMLRCGIATFPDFPYLMGVSRVALAGKMKNRNNQVNPRLFRWVCVVRKMWLLIGYSVSVIFSVLSTPRATPT